MEERDLRALYAYLNASEGVQYAVLKLVEIVTDNDATEIANEKARQGIMELLFPSAAPKE